MSLKEKRKNKENEGSKNVNKTRCVLHPRAGLGLGLRINYIKYL